MTVASRQAGFAVLGLSAVVVMLALLSWSVVAPTALQLRAAAALESRAAARLAAGDELAAAMRDLASGRQGAGDPGCCSGEAAAPCYAIERNHGQFRVCARGLGGDRTEVCLQAGVVLEPAQASGAADRVEIRWQRECPHGNLD
ncbi:hypothetical protein [Halorhodospira halophila]|uniref:Uncharacterized protein n=1 Tax=Halorhodospira halophila (strain DSM 244 / SL1) TaxID=349124 RepID=A1WY25_HALHL|nr:hypothetical protein [Halorhodospira halophila]ABM62587.1 hypothetical protein Hhal_1823 [Halorhodospira halophila SL1]MBK1728266.1 hypothetical protein [Halorhodospira halophila]